MKLITSRLILLLLIFTSLNFAQKKNSKYRMLYNSDGTDILGNYYYGSKPITIDEVKSYVDRVVNTPVTTFLICSGALGPYHKSMYDRAFGDGEDERLIKRLSERPEDSLQRKMMKVYNENFKILNDLGTDIVEICVNRAKEKGKEAFISVRMNDLHFTDTGEYFPSTKSEFWLNHPEYWMGDHPGWHASGAFNFAHKEVRDYKLNLIKEECEKYNIDGIELDFMRFFVLFPFEKGKEYLDVMTDWMKQIRKEINKIASKKKKKILLSIRVAPDVELCLNKGIDLKKWIKLNLIDFITAAPHWICDPNMPISKFKKDLGNPKIPLYATLDDGQFQPREFRSHGTYRGVAANYYSQGIDGLYFFNFFFTEKSLKELDSLKNNDSTFYVTIKYPDLLSEMASLNSLKNRNKIYSLSDGSQETSYHHNSPFPIFVSAWEEYKVKMNIPEDFSNSKPEEILLFIRGTKNSKFMVKLNGNLLSPANSELVNLYKRNANLLPDDEVYVFSIPYNYVKYGENDFNFRSIQPKAFFLKRMEVSIKFGHVKLFGYF